MDAKTDLLGKDVRMLSITEEDDPFTLLPVLVRADEVANSVAFK